MDFYSSPFLLPYRHLHQSWSILLASKATTEMQCVLCPKWPNKTFSNAFLKNLRRNVGGIRVRKVT